MLDLRMVPPTGNGIRMGPPTPFVPNMQLNHLGVAPPQLSETSCVGKKPVHFSNSAQMPAPLRITDGVLKRPHSAEALSEVDMQAGPEPHQADDDVPPAKIHKLSLIHI